MTRVSQLHASIGTAARTALCDAIASARRSIVAQFHSMGDLDARSRMRAGPVVDALNAAARRGVDVTLHVEADRCRYDHRGVHEPENAHARRTYEGYARALDARIHVIADADPLVLEHAKAVVVDGARAFIGTANPNRSGFDEPGAVMIEDDDPSDVAAVASSIGDAPSQTARVVSGPAAATRERISGLLSERADERIAIEDLSDTAVVDALIARRRDGLHDEILVKCERGVSASLQRLTVAGVDVRTIAGAYLHEKYIDAGDRIYVGSANLTRNGLDEAREIGIVARPDEFDDGAAALRADFNRMWNVGAPV
ncbi:MAG: phosphatidylserine/phosphatidylglycerophosphate/cardiolipin synthase family protein [Candidatus Eremiobacteraeota bacterium]|nr:phosphatidylserine/phosphatidylglycerophosphate/cardiolipin synthase family protein [Candidatus Eremiobacteraeota bacterium]MBV8366426.1 phosphatidylserine/phosphatidylglycerophosphate/cardiolipin synthase family protein [Candidatus Eremiobacteraeota bacterium]